MDAEFIVVNGPLLGQRFPLGTNELRIGKAPGSDILLTEHDAAWEHCNVRWRDGRFQLADRRTGAGTYVNGMRVAQHCLEPGDQVSICDTVLVYREDGVALPQDSQQPALLRACSLLFLFRAMAQARTAAQRTKIGEQITRLIADFVPCAGGAVLLGRNAEELHTAAAECGEPREWSGLIERVCREGTVIEPAARAVVLALYVRGETAGLLAAWFPPEEAAGLADYRDTLSAIGTVAAAGLENARALERLQTENAQLLDRLGAGESGIVGGSAAVQKLKGMIARVAPQDTPVLILGESGTGKELVARAVHRESARSTRPFVAINCAALTETLLESELFGHEKGAFTGAVAQKKGKLETAQGGTVFLDEIGELPMALQAKLLRVLQEREFERVGGTHTWKLDIRLVAATNRDLPAEVRRGAFREDLYHRLNVVALHVPPLRARAGDIPALARHFLALATARCRRRVTEISEEAEQCLMRYSWPGNIRELENAIERAVVLGQSATLLPEDLPETVLESDVEEESAGALGSSVKESKRRAILSALQESGGDYRQAAAKLNVHPNSLRRLTRKLNLRDPG